MDLYQEWQIVGDRVIFQASRHSQEAQAEDAPLQAQEPVLTVWNQVIEGVINVFMFSVNRNFNMCFSKDCTCNDIYC